MSRATPILSTFAGGELSPLLTGRVDLARYYTAARIMENFLALAEGPAERRGGTRFVGEVKDSANAVRLIPFEFSDVQAYMIEAGPGYLRFYMNRGRITSGGAAYEIATPYGAADLAGLRWCQSADVMYITHPDHGPRKLSRYAHDNWTLEAVDFVDGPYQSENITSTTLTPSAATGSVTINASGTGGINGDAGFKATDVGRAVRINHGGTWGWAKITSVASPTEVAATVREAFNFPGDDTGNPIDAASDAWRMGAWSDTTGWPGCVTFHEDRLCFGCGQRIDGSRTGDFETFSPGVEDGDPISYALGANQVQTIRWLASQQALLVGTQSTIFALRADTATAPLTPTNASAKRHSQVGAENIAPVEAGQSTLFVQRHGRRIHEAAFKWEADGYVTTDRTLFAKHMGNTGFVETAWQQEPLTVLWACRGDGALVGCTYMPDQEVLGWHRHPMPGVIVESVSVLPGAATDDLWLVTRRTINGVARRYVEVMEQPLPMDGAQSDGYYVDCGLSYQGAVVNAVSGLEHLEGETVQVLADGAVHPERVVTNGAIALDWDASTVHVGLGFLSRLEPMPFEVGSREGTAQGKVKRVSEIVLRLARSLGGRVGRNAANMEDILFRDPSMPMDAPPPLFAGDKRVTMGGEYTEDATVLIEQDQPLPMTVVAVMPKIVTSDA